MTLQLQKVVNEKLNCPKALNCMNRLQLVMVKAQQFLEITISGFNAPLHVEIAKERNGIQAFIRAEDKKWRFA